MSPTSDLARLLATLSPELHEACFVFATVPAGSRLPAALEVVAVREPEGLSVVVPSEQAEEHGIAATFPCAWITLQVHSALDAVGLLAAVTHALAGVQISANAVAGFHHDHLFVPWALRHEAVAALRRISSRIPPPSSATGMTSTP